MGVKTYIEDEIMKMTKNYF